MEKHVHTVHCPACYRDWTGSFETPLPAVAVCNDCLKLELDELRKKR